MGNRSCDLFEKTIEIEIKYKEKFMDIIQDEKKVDQLLSIIVNTELKY